jgi:hypothetical protein
MDIKDRDKKVIFYINEDLHARLRAQLYYDRLSQSKFINKIITAYLDNNPHIRSFLNDIKIEKQTKKSKKNIIKDFKERQQIIDDFALDKEEVENIFDILERENPDI